MSNGSPALIDQAQLGLQDLEDFRSRLRALSRFLPAWRMVRGIGHSHIEQRELVRRPWRGGVRWGEVSCCISWPPENS
jgi:hypothetical protein